jgi:transcriptional regulator with XRE-family HTH domain
VTTLSVIRRWALREQLSIREIARRTGLSRNTVRRYLRAGTVGPRYGTRISPSKLAPYADKLSGWLKAEANKSRKQRRTLKQMHADLVAPGFDGSYNRVAAFARAWTARRHEAEQTTGRGTFVPLTFGAGEAFQFTGARTGPSSPASAPNCRSRTSSSATAGPSCCGPSRGCARRRRCLSANWR